MILFVGTDIDKQLYRKGMEICDNPKYNSGSATQWGHYIMATHSWKNVNIYRLNNFINLKIQKWILESLQIWRLKGNCKYETLLTKMNLYMVRPEKFPEHPLTKFCELHLDQNCYTKIWIQNTFN